MQRISLEKITIPGKQRRLEGDQKAKYSGCSGQRKGTIWPENRDAKEEARRRLRRRPSEAVCPMIVYRMAAVDLRVES